MEAGHVGRTVHWDEDGTIAKWSRVASQLFDEVCQLQKIIPVTKEAQEQAKGLKFPQGLHLVTRDSWTNAEQREHPCQALRAHL
jgi:hypothetical protein